MQIIYKLSLSISATLFIWFVYILKEKIAFLNIPWGIGSLLCLGIIIVVTWVSLKLKKFLSSDSIEEGVEHVEFANDAFLPSYLGYFFVALSVNDIATMVVVYFVLVIFSYTSQTIYFNPVFLLFGYKFYYVDSSLGIRNIVITKKTINTIKGLKLNNLKRISIGTYIDTEDGDGTYYCKNKDKKQ